MTVGASRNDRLAAGELGELRQSFERGDARQGLLAAIVQSSHDAIISKDINGMIISWNPAAEELYGFSAEEAVGRHISFIIPPERRDSELENIMAHLRLSAETNRIETERLTKNGGRIEVEVRISPIRNAQGELLGASAIAHDIGERKRTERELARWRDELAKSNAELERFAYVASHDLQEPLRMIASYVQLLAKRYQGRLDSDADDFIAYAVDGANRMKTMIADLLKYSRAGHGDAFEMIDSGAALDRALANLQLAITETGATVTRGELPMVRGIKAQIAELFQNLVGNALKFHGEQPPRIQIAAQRDGCAWQFSVADNGIGIAPEYQEKIFEIFRRLHGREKYPGTGIGLTVCRKIVLHHGGQIRVESDEGSGATFRFTLPDAAAQSEVATETHASD
jgi:PAS domain S-box-containing protein